MGVKTNRCAPSPAPALVLADDETSFAARRTRRPGRGAHSRCPGHPVICIVLSFSRATGILLCGRERVRDRQGWVEGAVGSRDRHKEGGESDREIDRRREKDNDRKARIERSGGHENEERQWETEKKTMRQKRETGRWEERKLMFLPCFSGKLYFGKPAQWHPPQSPTVLCPLFCKNVLETPQLECELTDRDLLSYWSSIPNL